MIAHPLFIVSGRQDSNLRPPGPKPGAMTGLRYAPNKNALFQFDYRTLSVLPQVNHVPFLEVQR